MEFQRWWVLKSKLFAKESTVSSQLFALLIQFKLVYVQFRQSNMNSNFIFAPDQPVRKIIYHNIRIPESLLSYLIMVYTIYILYRGISSFVPRELWHRIHSWFEFQLPHPSLSTTLTTDQKLTFSLLTSCTGQKLHPILLNTVLRYLLSIHTVYLRAWARLG